MPAIGDFEYGFEASGVEQYLSDIKSEYLDKAKDRVEDISGIQTCCENEWEGKARDNFISNLQKDSEHVGEQFDALYSILCSEIGSLQAAMANKDEALIEED